MLFVWVPCSCYNKKCALFSTVWIAQLKEFNWNSLTWGEFIGNKQAHFSHRLRLQKQTSQGYFFFSSDLHSDLDLLFTMVAELISINCGICICGNSHKASWIRGLRNQHWSSTKSIMQKHCDLPNVLHLKTVKQSSKMPWYLLNWFMESVLEPCWLNFNMIDNYEQIRNILWHSISGDCFKTANNQGQMYPANQKGVEKLVRLQIILYMKKMSLQLGTIAINAGLIWPYESPINHPPSLSF